MELFARVNLGAFRDEERLNAVIETPKGSRNKFKYDLKTGLFELSGVLPVGASFPFDFGFIPETLAEDGDPLDVLILMDEPAFPGCVVVARLIGALKAEQTEEGKPTRNDRLIAVADKSHLHEEIRELDDVNDYLIHQIEHFFVSYNQVKGKRFKPLGRCSPKHARELVEDGQRRYLRKAEKIEEKERAA